jgi:DNA-binding PadR family transcriptional regulator
LLQKALAMSLPHAILGLLNITPMTGYDLKHQAFDSTISHFWQADQAQIYRTLNQLVEARWVECTLEVQQERPNRKVHHITEAGRAELRHWLHLEQALPVHREPFLVQLFFAGQLEDAIILAHLEKQRAAHQAILDQYRTISLPGLNDPTIERDRIFWRLTLEMGIAMEQMYIDWLDRALNAVRNLSD